MEGRRRLPGWPEPGLARAIGSSGESLALGLRDWTNELRSAVGLAPSETAREERRREQRRSVFGHKVIVRQRKALGILHLKNLSSTGGCGITDMPLPVGSLVFVQFRKPHFFAAEVRWARCLSVGVEFFRPVRPEMIEKFNRPAVAEELEPTPRKAKRRTDPA